MLTTDADEPKRDRRPINAMCAIVGLTFFGIATSLGYIIYETTLWKATPETLTLNTFLCMSIWFSAGEQNLARTLVMEGVR